MAQIHPKKSKSDEFAGVVVSVTGTNICPVVALARYLARRGSCPGPFSRCKRVPTTKPGFVQQFHQPDSPVPGHPSTSVRAGHSLRIGAATTAAKVGMEDSDARQVEVPHSSVCTELESAAGCGTHGAPPTKLGESQDHVSSASRAMSYPYLSNGNKQAGLCHTHT